MVTELLHVFNEELESCPYAENELVNQRPASLQPSVLSVGLLVAQSARFVLLLRFAD